MRLVAGTSYRESQEATEPSRQINAEKNENDLTAEAREIIRSIQTSFEGMTISGLLVEINRNLVEEMSFIPGIQRKGAIRNVLLSYGIHAQSAHPEDELDVGLYGLVVDEKRLLKGCKVLKPFKGHLEGITL
ncbi:hypothetical protein A9O66_11485 [Paraburkholderia caribensis]|uniref:Uncharacterized protein n=1 Tax=Paraburkholderia caribensis TaxID=75105 RepID=A0A9Q6S1P8_9BURK|nr:hypothetical protein A9O66_11485 [Paraburkholderia caribensis]